jgi:iron complex outermembrane recepter protein
MRNLFIVLFVCLASVLSAQQSVKGRVIDIATKEPIPFANVLIEKSFLGAECNLAGEFELKKVPAGLHLIKVNYVGYEPYSQEIKVENQTIFLDIALKQSTALMEGDPMPMPERKAEALSLAITTVELLDTAIVEATRADNKIPIAYTELTAKEITPLNNGQDMPYLLRFTPSLIATSDAGNGIGYTGLWIRGSDPSRINVTINGVPLNDPESQQVFWVNTPDFGSSVNNVQIQRGVGTSANGAAAFGGSIKLETRGVRTKPYAEMNNATGSFGTWKNNISLGTGLLNNHYIIEARLSRIASQGYIDRASSDLKSFFLEGNYISEKTNIKLTAFGGKENTYQSWNGTPHELLYGTAQEKIDFAARNYFNQAQTENLLNSGRTYNYYQYNNQVDNYGQNHFQAHISRNLNSIFSLNATAHCTHGEGYFEEFKYDQEYESYGLSLITIDSSSAITTTNLVRRRWLKNDLYGGVFSLTMKKNNWESVIGGSYNEYKGNHFGRIIWMQYANITGIDYEYYRGKSIKRDGNIYWKNVYTINKKMDVFSDMQLRNVDYATSGTDNDLRSYTISDNLLFFNPKVGLNYRKAKNERIYLSAAVGNKEPNRNDYVDAPTGSNIMPEKMLDLEAGYALRTAKWNVGINLYDMLYKNQLVLTGQLNDVGAPLRTNVSQSYRRGVEIECGWEIYKGINFVGNITLSQNKIKNFDETIYDYTVDYEVKNIAHTNTNISFSPAVIAAAQLSYRYEADKNYPNRDAMEFALMTKYVGKQYMDNTQNELTALNAYFVSDARFTYELTLKNHHMFTFNLTVNNLLNSLYSSNGYTYSYIYDTRVTERFYYPQAGRNFMVSLGVKL